MALLSYVAENERINIKQRQAEGIAAAKAKGVKFGRPPRPMPENFYEVHAKWRRKEINLEKAAEMCNLSQSTFYKNAKKIESQG